MSLHADKCVFEHTKMPLSVQTREHTHTHTHTKTDINNYKHSKVVTFYSVCSLIIELHCTEKAVTYT